MKSQAEIKDRPNLICNKIGCGIARYGKPCDQLELCKKIYKDQQEWDTLYPTEIKKRKYWKRLETKIYEPESKKEYEALVKQAETESRFRRLVGVFKKCLEMTPAYIDALKLCLAVVLSAKFRDDAPLWLDLVGTPGAGKTKLLTSLAGIDYVVFKSRITPAALVSGDRRVKSDPSLLPKLKDKCLIWKDFTEILGMKVDDKAKIYSTLRGAYDGRLDVDYGTGVIRRYTGLYFSMIAGVTSDTHLDDTASLGERRLKFKLPKTEIHTEKAKIRKALFTSESSEEETKELQTACTEFLRECNAESLPPLPNQIESRLISYAMVVGRLRTTVNREKYDSMHRITLKPEPEEAMRLAKQLKKLGQMIAIIMDEGEVTEDIFDLILDVGFSTPHPDRTSTFQAVNSVNGEMITKQSIAEKTGIASTTLSRTLDDMEAIGIVKRERGEKPKGIYGGRTGDKWCLTNEIKSLWEEV